MMGAHNDEVLPSLYRFYTCHWACLVGILVSDFGSISGQDVTSLREPGTPKGYVLVNLKRSSTNVMRTLGRLFYMANVIVVKDKSGLFGYLGPPFEKAGNCPREEH